MGRMRGYIMMAVCDVRLKLRGLSTSKASERRIIAQVWKEFAEDLIKEIEGE